MGWVIYYATLLLLFVGSAAYALHHPGGVPSMLRLFAGSLTMMTGLGQSLVKANFKIYLFSQRIWLLFNKDSMALWRFGLRLDGIQEESPIADLLTIVKADLSNWQPKIVSSNERQLRIIVDRTIHLNFTYESSNFSGDGESHLLVQSDELEVTYGSAKRKIDSCIVPILATLIRQLHPVTSSTMLNVSFSKRNPFFAFFVAHLDSRQISQFNLVFRPASITREETDKVIVTKGTIAISAKSPESFAMLAKAFLLLTEDAATMQTL